MSKNTIK